MTTIDARVAASADDAREDTVGTVTINASAPNADTANVWVAFRVNVTIPNGATINAAWLSFSFNNGSLDEPEITIYAEDVASAAVYVAGTATFTISTRARTTASVAWSSTDLGGPGVFNSPSIVSIIQELMASYSYASGAYIAIMHTSTNGNTARDAQIQHYDSDPLLAPLLHIEYTAAGGGGVVNQIISSEGIASAIFGGQIVR